MVRLYGPEYFLKPGRACAFWRNDGETNDLNVP